MTDKKPARLSDIISTWAPEGANDAKWILVEHQLTQAKMSVEVARCSLMEIITQPESANEAEIARDCYDMIRGMYLHFLEHYTTFLSYLAGTDVSERMSRKEL